MASFQSAIPFGPYRESIPIPLERSFCMMETRHQCGQKRDDLPSVGDPVRSVQGIHPDSAGAESRFFYSFYFISKLISKNSKKTDAVFVGIGMHQ